MRSTTRLVTLLASSGGAVTSAPDAPTGLAAAYLSSTSIRLTWTPGAYATEQKIYQSTAGGAYSLINTISDGSTATYDVSSLDAGEKYGFKVESVNVIGSALSSAVVMTYLERLKSLSPIGVFPLTETSGTVINEETGNISDGAYTGVTLNATTFVNGEPAPNFTASSSYGNIYSAALAALYTAGSDFNEGTISLWIKVASARWTDGQARVIFELGNSGSDKIYVIKPTTNNTLQANYVRSSTVGASFSTSSTNWMHIMMTWSKANSFVRMFVDGVAGTQYSGALTTLGGGLINSRALFGADSTTGTFAHIGNISYGAFWKTPLADAVAARLAVV